jgi:hypothetical protein
MVNPSSSEQKFVDRKDKLRKRKFVGSGVTVLRHDVPKLSAHAKSILNGLWHQHGMDIIAPLKDEKSSSGGADDGRTGGGSGGGRGRSSSSVELVKAMGSVNNKVAGFVNSQNKAELTETEKKVIDEARKGKFSLFLSILTIIDEETGPVATKYMLRKLSLVVRPADVPPIMDSKDIILSALHFLSSTYEVQSDVLLSLPLITPTQTYSDMEKRNYEKARDWKLDDIKEKLMRMEGLFFKAPTPYRWLPREVLAPSTLFPDEERDFFMKGVLSETISARKNRAGEAAARKRRRQEAKARAAAAAAAAAAGMTGTSSTKSATDGDKDEGKQSTKDDPRSVNESYDDDDDDIDDDDDANEDDDDDQDDDDDNDGDDDDDDNDDDDDEDDDDDDMVVEATVVEE